MYRQNKAVTTERRYDRGYIKYLEKRIMTKPQIIAAVFIMAIICTQVHAQDRVVSTAQLSNENVLADLWQESDLSSKEIPSYWYFSKRQIRRPT